MTQLVALVFIHFQTCLSSQCKALPHPPHHILNSSSTDLKDPSSIKKAIEAVGGQADAIIIATDVIPAFDLALQLTKKHGTFMVVGQPQKPINIPFDQVRS